VISIFWKQNYSCVLVIIRPALRMGNWRVTASANVVKGSKGTRNTILPAALTTRTFGRSQPVGANPAIVIMTRKRNERLSFFGTKRQTRFGALHRVKGHDCENGEGTGSGVQKQSLDKTFRLHMAQQFESPITKRTGDIQMNTSHSLYQQRHPKIFKFHHWVGIWNHE
jgi:hypothetical protein